MTVICYDSVNREEALEACAVRLGSNQEGEAVFCWQSFSDVGLALIVIYNAYTSM